MVMRTPGSTRTYTLFPDMTRFRALLWLYVAAYAILLGGLVNAEAERQTARDTTTGPEEPMGKRGAVVADTSAAIKPPEEQRAEKDAAINGDDPSSQDRVSR